MNGVLRGLFYPILKKALHSTLGAAYSGLKRCRWNGQLYYGEKAKNKKVL